MKFKDMPYKRVDYDKTAEQFKTLTKRVKEAKSGEELWEIHQEYYKVYQNMMDSMTIAEIRHDGNTADPFYAAEKDYYDETAPMLSSLATDYQRALYESPYRSFMEEKIGRVAFATMDNAIKSMDESIIGLMQEENALTTQYNKLIASAKIPFDGQVCNLSLLRPYLTGNDRTVRRQAWKAYSDYFMTVADELDDIYDKLVKNRTAQAKAMGYDNYIQLGYYRMNRNSYDRNDPRHLDHLCDHLHFCAASGYGFFSGSMGNGKKQEHPGYCTLSWIYRSNADPLPVSDVSFAGSL